ncbi:MAG TPA: TetR family transcriptional regulator [Solirubrobacteraceae bacterium]|jgi:AcrR family transcriptional regulator|nr:TetR family transcriptional regulator [Solirubrobacteraceae bacterium]
MSGVNEHDQREAPGARARNGARGAVRRPGSLSGGTAQRAKILAATRELTHEQGYSALTASTLIASARVSSRTFYEHFESAEACFTAAFDEAIAETSAIVTPVYQLPGPWLARVRDALQTLLETLDRDPPLATLLFLEAQRGGPQVQERRAHVQELLMLIVGGGRSASPTALPALSDEIVVGGAVTVIRARLSRPTHPPLLSLLNDLIAVLAHTYLDRESPVPESAMAPVARSGHERTRHASPPRRLTQRTLRVLAAIAEQPGATNREVSEAAGITDQGQICRVLQRLQASQLIVNQGKPGVGVPNAWHLSAQGEHMRHTTRGDFRQTH